MVIGDWMGPSDRASKDKKRDTPSMVRNVKVSLPTIVIHDVDNNIIDSKTESSERSNDCFTSGRKFQCFGTKVIKRDKLPPGSSAFQKVLQEINAEDETFGDSDKINDVTGCYNLDRAKTEIAASRAAPKGLHVDRMKTTVLGNIVCNNSASGAFLRPQNKQRRKSAPESQRPVLFSLPAVREKSVHWNEIKSSRNSASGASKNTTSKNCSHRSRHLSDGSLYYMKGVLKKTF